MIERIGHWLAHRGSEAMAWYDAQPWGVQLAVPVLLLVLACVVWPIVAHRLGEWWAGRGGE